MNKLFDVKQQDDHPIQRRDYVIPTPTIEQTYSIVRELVWGRRPGIVFYGLQQTGKTMCTEAISNLIQDEFPRVYVLLVDARRTKKENEKWLAKLLLSSMGHITSARDDPIDLLNNVVTHIRVQQSISQGDLCVLIIDEMHCLNVDHYFQLLDLSNILFRHKLRMTTIGFAQSDILENYTGFICRNNRQFIARFLSDFHPFNGCQDQSELAEILRFYDEQSEYPEDSGISYMQFYLPQAFEAGLRLEQEAPTIWKELEIAGAALDGQSIPMVHVTSTVEELLLANRGDDSTAFSFSEKNILDAVASSGLKRFAGMNKESETI